MKKLVHIALFKVRRCFLQTVFNSTLWIGLLVTFLVGFLFYGIGSIFDSLSLRPYFKLLITTQATFLSIIIAILMASVSSSPYTRTTKYILQEKWIVWKIAGLFVISLLINIVYFVGSGELDALITLIPFRGSFAVSYLRQRLELLPTVMASTGIALSLSLYYLFTVRGLLFSEEKAIAEAFESLVINRFPRKQISGNVQKSNTPLGHFCRYIDKAVRTDDKYALDAAISVLEDITIEFLNIHVQLMSERKYSDVLVVPTVEALCDGWKSISSVIIEYDHDYSLRVLMTSQYEIINELIPLADMTMGGQEIRSEVFETYFAILSHSFANDMYYDDIFYGIIGAPESRLQYKWELDILFDKLLETENTDLLRNWFFHLEREFEKRSIRGDILVNFTGLVASWARNFINDNFGELSIDFQNRSDFHRIYMYIDMCLMTLGKEIYKSDPLRITGWLYRIISICDAASESPNFIVNTAHQNDADIPWIIARISEAIGQLQYSLNTGEKEFAELLALLMHLSDKEAVKMGLGSVSRLPRHNHPYKINHGSNIVSFDDRRDVTNRVFYDLLELAEEIYQEISVDDNEIEDRIQELLAEDITAAIARSIDEDDLKETLPEESYIGIS